MPHSLVGKVFSGTCRPARTGAGRFVFEHRHQLPHQNHSSEKIESAIAAGDKAQCAAKHHVDSMSRAQTDINGGESTHGASETTRRQHARINGFPGTLKTPAKPERRHHIGHYGHCTQPCHRKHRLYKSCGNTADSRNGSFYRYCIHSIEDIRFQSTKVSGGQLPISS